MATDYYRVLGVMPGADEVVIRAAYKALAQRYHPDRFAGNPAEAHRRMAEINAAFAVLGDPEKRAAYDAERADGQTAEFAASDDESQQDQAFSDALEEMDRRWRLACGIFPDLEDLRNELHCISSKLSFAFVMIVLESKNFNDREEIAQHLEKEFLQRYFGRNVLIQDFAKELIFSRNKEAAKALNDLVSVMGEDVDPALLIGRVADEFGLVDEKERRRLCEELKRYYNVRDAVQLAELAGFSVRTRPGGFFKGYTYVVMRKGQPNEVESEISGERALIEWAQSTFCG